MASAAAAAAAGTLAGLAHAPRLGDHAPSPTATPPAPPPGLEWAPQACSFKAACRPKGVFRPLRRRQGAGFTFKAAQGLLGRPAGWRRRDQLTAAGPGEAAPEPEPEPEPEREAGLSGRLRSARADRAGGRELGVGLRGGVVWGAARERTRPARGEGARFWMTGVGSFQGRRGPQDVMLAYGEGSSWARPGGEGTRNPAISAP